MFSIRSASTLFISATSIKISALSQDAAEILMNSEIIEINQHTAIGEPLVPFF